MPAAYIRYTLDLNLTDEQVNHPLMREAEGIVSGECFGSLLDVKLILIPSLRSRRFNQRLVLLRQRDIDQLRRHEHP